MPKRNVIIGLKSKDETKGGFDSARRGLKGVKDDVSGVSAAFAGLGALAAVAGISKLVGESIEATRAWEQSSNRLDAVLRATGHTIGFTRGELDKMTKSLMRDTAFTQNDLRDSMSILATFKSVQGETFSDAIELSADLSAVMGQSLKSSVVQLGKALEDPTIGLSALREVGISFTAEQQEMIKTLDATGEKAKAQRIILEALEGQFGGTAGNEKQGVHGALIAVDQEWHNLLITMGKTGPAHLLVKSSLFTIAGILENLSGAAEDANKKLEQTILFGSGLTELPPAEAPTRGPSASAEGGTSEILEQVRTREQLEAINAQLRAERMAQEAAEERKNAAEKKARATAAAAEEKERMSEAAFLSKQFAKEQVDAIKAHEQAIQDKIAAMQRDIEKEQDLAAMINETAAIATENEDKRKKADEDARTALIRRTLTVFEALNSETEQIDFELDRQTAILVEARNAKLISDQVFYDQAERLRKNAEAEQTRIVDEETKKRFGISTVYRKLDLQSSQFFLGQMSELMLSNNRALFEVGKAAAIGETIIQTYRAAQGAFASLAPIPFIGPVLGAAAAGAAIVGGLARVQAIRSTSFGGGGAATPTFNAGQFTGLPTDFGPQEPPLFAPEQQAAAAAPANVNITLLSESGVVSTSWVRDELIPKINEAAGDGVNITAVAA